MSNPLEHLAEHLEWADNRARASLDSLEAGSSEHEQARALFAHIAASEHVWLARIDGRSEPYPVWPEVTLDRATEMAAEAADRIRRLVEGLEPGDEERPVTYRNSSGREFENRLEDILLHLCLHGMYHRGQIAQLVRKGGGEPASTDYIALLRGAAAPANERGVPVESSVPEED